MPGHDGFPARRAQLHVPTDERVSSGEDRFPFCVTTQPRPYHHAHRSVSDDELKSRTRSSIGRVQTSRIHGPQRTGGRGDEHMGISPSPFSHRSFRGCSGHLTSSKSIALRSQVAFRLPKIFRLGQADRLSGQCCRIFSRRKRALSASCSIPSTPSSMLTQLSNPTLRSSRKMAS
jgi:hypothetical protein